MSTSRVASSTNTGEAGEAGDKDAACKRTAAQLRRDHPRWVVIWAARKGDYQARPLFRATPRMIAAATPGELVAQMGCPMFVSPRARVHASARVGPQTQMGRDNETITHRDR